MSSIKTKIYVPVGIEGKPIIKLVETYRGVSNADETIFTNGIPADFAYSTFKFVDSADDADFALSPHGIRRAGDWAHRFAQELAQRMNLLGKKTVVFVGGDLSFKVRIRDEGIVVLIGSQYKSILGDNEIIVPPFAEDPFDGGTIEPLARGDMPRVGFCGWASFPTAKSHLVSCIKKFAWDTAAFITRNQEFSARARGLFFRIAGIKTLQNDSRIIPSFIIRSTFSANKASIAVDPEIARKDFVENMKNNHFIFAPKGDGNFSVRFYEALAFGRVPVLIDTDMALPLEYKAAYDKCIVRVPHTDISRVGDYIMESFTNEDVVAKQKEARNLFRSMLRYDSFFNELFARPLDETLQASRAFYARRNKTIE